MERQIFLGGGGVGDFKHYCILFSRQWKRGGKGGGSDAFCHFFSLKIHGWGSVPPNHLTISWICLFWLVWIQVNHYNYYKLFKLFSYYLKIRLNIKWSLVCMKAFSTTYNRHWESWRIFHARPVYKLSWVCHEARSWTLQIRHGWSYNPQRTPFLQLIMTV